MKSTAPTKTHHHRTTAGLAPWKQVRPAIIGTSGLNVTYATCSVSGSAGSSPQTFYGTPVELSGSPMPDQTDYGIVVEVGISPVSVSAEMDVLDTTAPISLVERLTSYYGVVWYQDGEKFDVGGTYTYFKADGTIACSSQIFPYGGIPIRRVGSDIQNSISGSRRLIYGWPAQSWPAPYVPDAVGLGLYASNGSVEVECMVMAMHWRFV